ncbi:uncharacterized protein LOC123695725 [Colias croceus]|uniref:uncharacterized protein LOC123695725 n=1 Tax=Colias crocea TaxID=72248 RepID=UPI001E27E08F|nr:uncharacterized protein LOC123695725 [Colias croceus]
MISTNYLVFLTIALMVMLTVLLPNFSYRVNKTTELQEMKKVLDDMEEQIGQAEAACFTAAEELCILQYTMRDEETNTRDFLSCRKNLDVLPSTPVLPCTQRIRKIRKKSISFDKSTSTIELYRRKLPPSRRSQQSHLGLK